MALKIDGKKKSLMKNTVMLYILTFSTHLLSLILVPYQTRVLGKEMFGVLGLVTSVMVYFQLVIDFGFILSATEEVSTHREDKGRLGKIFTSVTLNKLLLSLLSGTVLMVLCQFVPRWGEYRIFFLLYFIATAVNSLLPDYLYRGIEQMSAITVRTVAIKIFSTALIFLLVKSPEDYLLIPFFNIVGNSVALLATYFDLFRRIGVRFAACKPGEIFSRFKASSLFFLSRIATTAYTAANTIVLDTISGGTMTAYYTSADKIVTTAKTGMSPLADSLYPYMVKHRDFSVVKKMLLFAEPVILFGCGVVFVFAKPLCLWYFGAEFTETAYALRALLPVVAIILPSYIFGFPVMGAMGLSKHANYSVIVGSLLHVVNLVLLYSFGLLTVVTLGIATSVAEAVILLYRIVVVILNKSKLRTAE